MNIVDGHCHASPVWFEPVETLLFQMDRNGVAQAVLTQVLGQLDNSYQQACVQRYRARFASVVAVDPAAPDATGQLRRLADAGATGVRLRPLARSPGPDPYSIWRAAADCRLAVSCAGPATDFLSADFAQLLETVADLPVVLEHLGGWARPDCPGSEAIRVGIGDLARFANVSLKVPALGQLVTRPGLLPVQGRTLALEPASIVLEMLRRFGAQRLMWGSDFPPVASREGYANALLWVRELLDGSADGDRAAVFGSTAARIFRLPPS